MALISVVARKPGAREIYHFVLPSMVIVSVILLCEKYVCGPRSVERFVRFFRTLIPFSVGVAVPILLFLIPYIASGSVHTLLGGVFSSASSRAVGLAVVRPLDITKVIYALPLIVWMILAVYW